MGDSPKWVKSKTRREYSRDCGWPRRPWPNAGRRKQKKRPKNHLFFLKKIKFTPPNFFFCIYLLVMPKYWVKNYFAHGRFPKVGQKQKTEEKEEREKDWTMVITMAKLRMAHASTHCARKPPGPKERKRERLNNGENNGQATHGACKHAWRTQAAWANFSFFIHPCIIGTGSHTFYFPSIALHPLHRVH